MNVYYVLGTMLVISASFDKIHLVSESGCCFNLQMKKMKLREDKLLDQDFRKNSGQNPNLNVSLFDSNLYDYESS